MCCDDDFRSRRKFFLHIFTKHSTHERRAFLHKFQSVMRRRKKGVDDDAKTTTTTKKVSSKSSSSNKSSTSGSKARKRKDLVAIGKILKCLFLFTGILLGLSMVGVKRQREERQEQRVTTSSFPPEEQMKELEKAREMLRANYVQAYDAIENEFNVFSNQKMLDVYADMFSESLGEEARAAIWERATEKFYSRAEYSSADGERARRQREAHGTFAPEVSAKKEFAADDPKRFKRLVELVRDKMENGAPPKEGEQKGEKDVEVTMRAETKKAARSAALTAFVFEVLQTLQEEGSSYFAEKAPDFDHV